MLTFLEDRPYVELAQKFRYKVMVVEPATPWWLSRDISQLVEKNSHGVPRESIEGMLERWEDDGWDMEGILKAERPAMRSPVRTSSGRTLGHG